MICASLYRPFFIQNLLRYLAEKILLLNTTNFRGDYPFIVYEPLILLAVVYLVIAGILAFAFKKLEERVPVRAS